jgi:type I restriction enzyme R subunit
MEQFLARLGAEIARQGALAVLRNDIFRPASELNEETRRLHAANLFATVRQVRCSTKSEKSLDLVLFLSGIPIFTAELTRSTHVPGLRHRLSVAGDLGA